VSAVTDEASKPRHKGEDMTSKGIAQRLIAAHGPRHAKDLVSTRVVRLKAFWNLTPATSSQSAAQRGAYTLFWTAVLWHLNNP